MGELRSLSNDGSLIKKTTVLILTNIDGPVCSKYYEQTVVLTQRKLKKRFRAQRRLEGASKGRARHMFL